MLELLLVDLPEAGRYHGRKEEDFLVLPMDVTKLETHAECLKAVLDRFGKVSK